MKELSLLLLEIVLGVDERVAERTALPATRRPRSAAGNAATRADAQVAVETEAVSSRARPQRSPRGHRPHRLLLETRHRRSAAQVELVDQDLVALGRRGAQVLQELAALPDHQQQAATRGVVLAVRL